MANEGSTKPNEFPLDVTSPGPSQNPGQSGATVTVGSQQSNVAIASGYYMSLPAPRKYAHMCRDEHEEIGHNDSSNELCPLCRERNRAETAETSLARVRGLLQRAQGKLLAVDAILVQVRGENEIASTGLKPEHHALAYAWSCKVAEMIGAEWGRIDTVIPQSSSLVSQGAESADIGKLDTADKSGVVDEKVGTE